ncbi:T9SS type A sorting domain-containing protein [Chryseobacterium sp. SIMBA_038]
MIATIVNAQITLGSGTTTGAYPIASNWGYNYTQQIISKTSINAAAAGNITGLKFYLPAAAVLDKSNQWEVFVGHTTLTAFAGTTAASWIATSAMTQVFTGTITNNAGVVEVTFTTPFAYNNTDNLVIAVHENKPDFNSSSDYFYTSASGTTNSSMYYRNDTTDFNPAVPVAAGGRAATLSNVTLLGLLPASAPVCPVVSAPSAAATGVSVLPTITWAASASASSYKISIGTTPGGTNVMNMTDVGNVTTYTLGTALNFSTQYYYTVYATNVVGNSTGCAERSFTTASLACPSVSSPTAAQTGLSVKPTFTWSTIAGATGYRLSIGTSAGATDILNSFDLGNVLTYTLTTAQQLTPNTQYYYTITAYSGGAVSTGCAERNFKTTTAAIPANDECANALTVSVSPDTACGATTAGNTLGATNSLAAAPCSGNPDDDVWFKFVATSSAHIVTLSNVVSTGTTSTTDMYFQVLSGVCGSQTSLLCSDPNTGTVTGLTAGQTYYVRVYTYAGAGYNASFNICIGTPPPPPANDECVNAVSLTVNPDLACGVTTAGTTLSATNSNVAVGTCTGTADDDVWYSFVATSTAHVITLSNVVSTGSSSSTSLYTQVFSGTCGTLASVACGTTNSTTVGGLTPGQMYYVRAYNSNGSGYSNSFSICVGTPPPPPANDTCSGAVALTVGNNFAASPLTTSNAGATTDGTTSCQTSRGDNVWFSVVVPASGSITVETKGVTGSGLLDTVLSAHSGTCGSLTSVGCNDDSAAGGVYSLLSLTGQTPGATLYFSVWRYTGTAGGTSTNGQFQISAYDASVLGTSETSGAKNSIKVYPNPFADDLTISDISKVKSVLVTDISGRLVKTISNPGSTLHLGELKSGMYLVTLEMKDGTKQTIKTIKK